MELPSFEGSSVEAAAALSGTIFAHTGKPSAPNVQRQSGKSKQPGRQNASRVLMLGRLRELALYRAEVLRHHGFHVSTPETDEEAAAMIREGDFDVAVLSYTLSDVAVQHFVELVRAQRPDCPIVAIAQTMTPDRRIQPDLVVLADKGPAELVTALRRVLHQS